MDTLAVLTAVASVLAAAGVLFNGWQTTRVEARLSSRIDQLTGRLDSLESTVQTVLTALVQRRGD